MFVPDILTQPLLRIDDRTSDFPLFDDGDVQIGIWECSPGTADDDTGDFDETMFMVSGRVSVRHDDTMFDVAPGTLWTTPRDWTCTWDVHQKVRKLYVIDNRSGASGEASHLANAYNNALGLATRRPVVIAGDPHESSSTLRAHNRLETGVWSCTPGEFPFRRDGYDEVFCLLAGHATLHIDGHEPFDLRPGSVALTPAGSTGRWVVDQTVRKAYTIVHR